MTPAIDWDALSRAALDTRLRAYAPYSKYRVGAAVLAEDGRIFAGCNVENASFGLTICAERTAVVSMIAAGARRFVAVVVVTGGPEAGAPCGACRQTLFEFAGDAPVRMLAVDGAGRVVEERSSSVYALLPDAFRPDQVPASTPLTE